MGIICDTWLLDGSQKPFVQVACLGIAYKQSVYIQVCGSYYAKSKIPQTLRDNWLVSPRLTEYIADGFIRNYIFIQYNAAVLTVHILSILVLPCRK